MSNRLRGFVRVGIAAAAATVASAGFAQAAAAAVRADAPGGAAATGVVKVRVLGLGTVTSSPAGINCAANTTCQANFNIGTRLTLSTAPGTGWVFHVWDPAGPCASAGGAVSCTFTVGSSFQEVAPLFVGLTLKDIAFGGKFSRSVLTGTVTVAGFVSHPSTLTLTLTGPSKKTFSFAPAAGDFQQTFKLPKNGFAPGTYNATISGAVTGHVVPPQSLARVLPGPKEGVVGKAWISAFGGSAPVSRLPKTAIGATAHFVFSANPVKGSAVTATWFRNKKRIFGPIGKPRTQTVESFVGVRNGHLAPGFYTCVLKARGLVVKQVGIQVG